MINKIIYFHNKLVDIFNGSQRVYWLYNTYKLLRCSTGPNYIGNIGLLVKLVKLSVNLPISVTVDPVLKTSCFIKKKDVRCNKNV